MTRFDALYRNLFAVYGPQHWWPAQTDFEVIAGAVLTQNTAWTNVEHALLNLRKANALSASRILDLPSEQLSELLRPAGCHTVKSRRLQAVCEWLKCGGGSGRVDALSTSELRSSLLSVHGVGQETADAILLYAYGRPVFIVDTYARRLFSRTGLIRGEESYREIQTEVESSLGSTTQDYNEFHAVIVEHGKQACRKTPRCADCPIRYECRYSTHHSGAGSK
ncbi:endonuclease III domain-containing protein [Pseudomonadota bacterium]